MQVEVFDTRDLTEADRLAIAELLVATWPDSAKTVQFRVQQQVDLANEFADSSTLFPHSVLVRDGDSMLAHACLVPRTVRTTQGELLVAGLAKVCTDSTRRKKGLGAAVVRAAFDLVDQSKYAFSLFQTSPEVQPFYEKLGSCTVSNRLVNSLSETPDESPFWNKVAMRYPAGEGWPTGVIDLLGPGY